jgi:hypothetical protein
MKMRWFENMLNFKINENLILKNRKQLLRLRERKFSKDLERRKNREEVNKNILRIYEISYSRKNMRKCLEQRKEGRKLNEFRTRKIY